MDGKMTARQRQFVAEYLIDLNATRAAIRAGYSEKTAEQIGYQLLQKTSVADAIAKGQAKKQEKLELTGDWVLQELAAIARADATDYATVERSWVQEMRVHPITGEPALLARDGPRWVNVIATADLPPDKRKAVASIEATEVGIKVKTYDKVRALGLLGKHFGLFDRKEAPPVPENNLYRAIVESAQEDMDTGDIPEVEQEAVAGDDMVGPPSI